MASEAYTELKAQSLTPLEIRQHAVSGVPSFLFLIFVAYTACPIIQDPTFHRTIRLQKNSPVYTFEEVSQNHFLLRWLILPHNLGDYHATSCGHSGYGKLFAR
jgi:hypothetical protein